MIKYKLDKWQKAVIFAYIFGFYLIMGFPFRFNSLTESMSYGIGSPPNWVILVYLLIMCLHPFGYELYDFKKHVFISATLVAGNLYFKIFMFKNEYIEIQFSGIIFILLGYLIVIGVLALDRFYYQIEVRRGN